MTKIGFKKYYIEEHVFRGDLMLPYPLLSIVPHVLGGLIQEMVKDKLPFGKDAYFDHSDDEEQLPNLNPSGPLAANFHFAIAIDKEFTYSTHLEAEAEWFLTKLLNNRKLMAEIDSIRQYLGSIQNQAAEGFKQALQKDIIFGTAFKLNLEQAEISEKDTALSILMFKRILPLMKKYNIPDEYFHTVLMIVGQGAEKTKEDFKDFLNLIYFRSHGSVVYMTEEVTSGFRTLQSLVTTPLNTEQAGRTNAITAYFQKHFFVKNEKILKPYKYNQFNTLFKLDHEDKKIKDLEKGKIIFGDSGKNKSPNVAKLRQEMNKDLKL